jgi:SMC interacting uncharacterized protein involved in chromosome segregation
MMKLSSELADFKFKVQQFTDENERLKRRVQEAGDLSGKIGDMERKARELEYRNQALEREKGDAEGRIRSL